MYKPVITVSILALTALGWMQDRSRPVVALGECKMILEWTPGQEAVVRIAAESEEELERIQVFLPDGSKFVDLDARNGGRRGLSCVELELREPDIEALLADYAEGTYDIRATTVRGYSARGNAKLSSDLPPRAHIVHPLPGELVQGSNLTLFWLANRHAAGYELQLEQGEEDGLRVKLPPERSSFRVPDNFLQRGKETSFEVAVIGANGNRTVTEVLFTTRP